MPPAESSPKLLIVFTIWMTAFTVILLWGLYHIRDVLLLLYIAGLFAVGFSPVVRLIERQRLLPVGTHRFPRWLAILVLYVVILSALVSAGMIIVPPLFDQAQELWDQRVVIFDQIQQVLHDKGILRGEYITFEQAVERAPNAASEVNVVGTVYGAVRGVVGGIVGFVTILIVTFYLLIDSRNIQLTFLRLFPARARNRIDVITRTITLKVSAWLAGQMFLGAIIGITTAIGLWVLGVPFFYVLAVIAGFGELIPVIGPILSAIPAVIVAGTVSLQKAALVIVFFVVQQQFENHVLVPRVMSRQVGVSPVTVIIALLIGGRLLGVVGALLAVPTAAIVQVLFTELLDHKEKPS